MEFKWWCQNGFKMSWFSPGRSKQAPIHINDALLFFRCCNLERWRQRIRPSIVSNVHFSTNSLFPYPAFRKKIAPPSNNTSKEKVWDIRQFYSGTSLFIQGQRILQVWSKINVHIWSVRNRKVSFALVRHEDDRNDLIHLGTKYDHALKWGIPVLKPEWIFESSEKGSCLRLENYLWSSVNREPANSKGSVSSQ